MGVSLMATCCAACSKASWKSASTSELWGGTDAAIDGSTIEADANRDRKDAPDAVQKIWSLKDQVQRPVADYLDNLAEAEGSAQSGPKKKPPKYLSETDPEAAWSLKDGPGRFSL